MSNKCILFQKLLLCITAVTVISCGTPGNPPSDSHTDSIPATGSAATKMPCDSLLPVDNIRNSNLMRWMDFYSNKHHGLTFNSFKFHNCSEEGAFLTHDYDPEKEYLELYSPLLLYSPDHSMFIDMDSYNFFLEKDKKGNLTGKGGDPETEVALIDLKNHTHQRLFYNGPSVIIDDAAWISPHTIAIIYLVEFSEKNSYQPAIVLIDLDKKTYSYYDCPVDIDPASAHDYLYQIRWKSIKVKE
jgi:hypothetical protein